MALISVIVPAHGVQAYLRECLLSVLEQDFSDVEIIAVNDCSPDQSGAIIDDVAAGDPRVRPLHLAENAGLGGARNAGLAAATGRYVLFLDGDDTLAPGSLAAIADRLEYGDYPQLLIYDYARTWWDGHRTASWAAEILASLSASVFTPSEHPRLFNLLPIACNKVYRRDFLQQLGLKFPTGYYEDIPFTYTVLLEATSAVTLNMVVLLYRQRRTGSILGSTSPRHVDVFGRYDDVFTELDRRGIALPLRKHIFDIMVNHYVKILRHADRLAPADRPGFYEQARRSVCTHNQDWSAVPKQNAASNLRIKLFLNRSYRSFTLYNRIDATRISLRRTASAIYWPTRRAVRRVREVGRLYYFLERLRPIDPNLVVFSEYWGNGYGCNPRAIFERLAEVAPNMKAVWLITAQQAVHLPPGTAHLAPDSWRRYSLFARGKYFVNNVNFPGTLVKRPGQVHLQTMHGTPLKHCGLDVLSSSVASTAVDPVRQPKRSEGRLVATDAAQSLREFENLLRRSDRWDFALSSNSYSTEKWSHAYPCRYEWLEFGYPRNDALINSTPEEVATAREFIGVPVGATAILYAPTFREAAGDTSMRIDLETLLDELPESTVFIVRAHHTATETKAIRSLMESGRVIDGSKVPRILSCYLAADVLLTDYSSVMFDYALLDRPIVIYADDWHNYLQTRGAYFDLLAAPPGLVARNARQLAKVLAGREYLSPRSVQLRREFRARFCTFDDGRAAERVIDAMLQAG